MKLSQVIERILLVFRHETMRRFRPIGEFGTMRSMKSGVLALGLAFAQTVWCQTSSPCDLNQDGQVNAVDVQLAIDMSLGTATCSANVVGTGICNVVVVQRVANAVLGGSCSTGSGARNVTLNWTASSTPSVSGYNVYRTTTVGGPYTKINTSLVIGTSYTDSVPGGLTYYYVATAVDGSQNESTYSNVATAAVPTP